MQAYLHVLSPPLPHQISDGLPTCTQSSSSSLDIRRFTYMYSVLLFLIRYQTTLSWTTFVLAICFALELLILSIDTEFTPGFQWCSCCPSGAPEFTPGFQWCSYYSIFILICMFCRSLFVLLYFFLLAIVLSVLLQLTYFDYPFGIFKLFFLSIDFASVQ